MSLLSKFITMRSVTDNLTVICRKILNYYGAKYEFTTVDRLIKSNLEYPSILAIMDTLSKYGIASAAIRKGKYDYLSFEIPFICAIQRPDWPQSYFTVVTAVDDRNISYFDPIKNIESIVSKTDFEQIDKDIILLLDGEKVRDEIDYLKNHRKALIQKQKNSLPFVFFSIVLIVSIGSIFISPNFQLNLIAATLMLFTAIGYMISLLLVWYEIDSHNPFLKEVCGGGGRKLSCAKVLKSNGASLFGISWSVIGFSYFATILLTQLLFGSTNPLFQPYWILLFVLALPYTFYSIYYQWRIVKQWCPLCVAVQIVLFLSGILSLAYSSQFNPFVLTLKPLFIFLFIGISFLILISTAIPLLKLSKESQEYQKKWKRLRYNPDVFNMLLKKETSVLYPVDSLGILVGNPDAKHEIIKVCNPYCGPCAKAHPELEELIRSNPNIKVRIIFTVSGKENDHRTAPVQHLLAIQKFYGAEVVREALDNWYMADTKDYAVFASKYPVDGELNQQGDKIEKMKMWCDRMKIRVTPTFFVNGHELPDSYRINELKDIFRETT